MRKKYTVEDYQNKCLSLNLKYIGFHKEKKRGTMIEFVCKQHLDKGIQTSDWSHFKDYKKGCPFCAGRGKTNKELIPLIKNKDVILLSEYVGCEKPILCKCKQCQNEWTTIPKVLTTNGAGCPKCGKLKASIAESKTKEQFIKELNLINPNIKVLGEYKNTHTKIKCKCIIDDTEWDAYPANLLNQSAGCPICNMSSGERDMLNVLDKLNIEYISQYSIDDCKYVNKLKFDAFSISYNIAFEFNGEQHYYPVDFAGKGEEWAKEQFQLTKSRDNAKIEYCNKNNIPMIIIPYWEKSNMENIIKYKIKEIKKTN